jgi:HEAT repeat protein
VPGLIRALSHPNQVSIAAALALGRIAHPDAVGPLTAVLEDDVKFWMPRGAAAVALGQMGAMAHAARPALINALELDVQSTSTAWDVCAREAVADAIQHIDDPTFVCALAGKGQRYAIWDIY